MKAFNLTSASGGARHPASSVTFASLFILVHSVAAGFLCSPWLAMSPVGVLQVLSSYHPVTFWTLHSIIDYHLVLSSSHLILCYLR